MAFLHKKRRRQIVLRMWRRPTAALRPLPDFLGLGAQRSGTSTLNYCLSQHPQFASPIRKEVHYFDKNYDRGPNWYRAHFPLRGRRTAVITGEITPYYLFHPYCPTRIANLLPEARFVVVLRNPVHRAISHYWKQFTRGHETLEIEAAFQAESERLAEARRRIERGEEKLPLAYQKFSYVSRGHYAEQLQRYFDIFPRSRFLIIQNEALRSDTVGQVNKVFEFLGIKPIADRLELSPRGAITPNSEVPERLINKLHDYFKPLNRQLFDLLGEEWDW